MSASQQPVASSNTLDSLPTQLRHGLPIVAICGLLSLTTTLILFSCLTYRLLTWYHRGQIRNGANQFFILVYNLVIADLQQAIAFTLTTVYVVHDKIEVDSSTCGANGWFVSVGDMASGVFILSIALHTFLAVAKNQILSDRLFYTWLAGAWSFVYLLAALTVTLHPDVYARAGAWCWIDQKYDKARLWLHYFWIFACMLGTIITYGLVYISINTKLASNTDQGHELAAMKRAAKYMIIYPGIYVVCTLPLAGGRMAAMTGVHIPYWYYCLAGAAITSCGWLDVILYIFTRRALLFSKTPPSRSEVGLHTFGWYHGSELYGTTTTIEGPLTGTKKSSVRLFADMASDVGTSWLPRKKSRLSDEQHFAAPMDGVITTRTTVEVTSGPLRGYSGTYSDVLELDEDRGIFDATSGEIVMSRSSRDVAM